MYEKLPQELKERGAFCLWKYEERDGNRTKVPYQTNGLRADSANKATFTNYAIAVRHRAGYDGIGIGVFGDICAIDIDSCVEDGVLSDMAEDIIARMDTYTEYSPSGTGVRILFKASLPAYDKDRYYINNRQIKLEVYVAGYTSRFVTVTRNSISGTGIEERTDALAEVLEKYMRRAQKPVSSVTAPGSYLSDTSVLQKAMASKQAEKFKALWNGIILDGKSHSEADAALCTMLAFWCGGDTEQMDRLFRQSALMRDKWERDDYRTATLTKAVAMCVEFYKPVGRSSAAYDFNDLQQTLRELAPAENDRYPWNDIGNGRLFADVFKDIARFVPERKQWHIYDGTRWVSDTASLKAMDCARLWPMRSCGMRWISTMSISAKAISISAGNGRAAICASRSSPMPRAYIRSPCRSSTATVSYSTAPTARSISARWPSGNTVPRTGSRRSRPLNTIPTHGATATAALSARS